MRKEAPQNARTVLASNVGKLIARAGSQPALVKVVKVPQKTISRALNDENAANLDTLNSLAQGCGLHPWQLLVPNLDIDNPPMLATDLNPELHRDNSITHTKLDKLPKRGGNQLTRSVKNKKTG